MSKFEIEEESASIYICYSHRSMLLATIASDERNAMWHSVQTTPAQARAVQ